ncbi:MAG: hypothetical protein ACRDLB_13525 [Actinomycetota bacterium]
MSTFATILDYLMTGSLALLAFVTLRQWIDRRDETTFWVMVTFTSLGAIAVFGLFFPEEGEGVLYNILSHVLIVVVLLFPYLLYRVAASFAGPSKVLDRVVALSALFVIGWAVIEPEFPEAGEERPTRYAFFILAALVYWVALSTIVAVRFWRAGASQKSVASARMKMLAVASMTLSLAIVISGSTGSEESTVTENITSLIVLLSIGAFFLAFAPPEWLRSLWRRQPQEGLRRAVTDMMVADTVEEVTDKLLPHAAAVVGGQGIAFIDDAGRILGSYGMTDVSDHLTEDVLKGDEEQRQIAPHLLLLRFKYGSLLVHTNPYTPFFGQDEIELLGSLGAVGNLAIERVRAAEMKVQLAESQLRRKQALEINDNIVQGLAVAKYAFEAGQNSEGMAAVEGTLAAARSIISKLLEEIGREEPLGPGSLVRDEAAPNFTDFLRR